MDVEAAISDGIDLDISGNLDDADVQEDMWLVFSSCSMIASVGCFQE